MYDYRCRKCVVMQCKKTVYEYYWIGKYHNVNSKRTLVTSVTLHYESWACIGGRDCEIGLQNYN